MPGCAAIGTNSSKKGFLMKSFPRDPKRRKEWTIRTKRANWNPTNYSRLCEVCFEIKFDLFLHFPFLLKKIHYVHSLVQVIGTKENFHYCSDHCFPVLFSFVGPFCSRNVGEDKGGWKQKTENERYSHYVCFFEEY